MAGWFRLFLPAGRAHIRAKHPFCLVHRVEDFVAVVTGESFHFATFRTFESYSFHLYYYTKPVFEISPFRALRHSEALVTIEQNKSLDRLFEFSDEQPNKALEPMTSAPTGEASQVNGFGGALVMVQLFRWAA